MTFSRFLNLGYETKLKKHHTAFIYLANRMGRLSVNLRAVRNYYRMKEIYENVHQLNRSCRTIFVHLKSEKEPVHPDFQKPATYFGLIDILLDTLDLLEEISDLKLSTDDLNLMFLMGHNINDMLRRYEDAYVIKYDWDKIFKYPNYIVS